MLDEFGEMDGHEGTRGTIRNHSRANMTTIGYRIEHQQLHTKKLGVTVKPRF